MRVSICDWYWLVVEIDATGTTRTAAAVLGSEGIVEGEEAR
jgi:hypothetical protein